MMSKIALGIAIFSLAINLIVAYFVFSVVYTNKFDQLAFDRGLPKYCEYLYNNVNDGPDWCAKILNRAQ